MSAEHIILSIIEGFAVLSIIVGLIFEGVLVRFEKRIFKSFKKGLSKIIRFPKKRKKKAAIIRMPLPKVRSDGA